MISDLKFIFCTITYPGSYSLKWLQTKETGAIEVTEKKMNVQKKLHTIHFLCPLAESSHRNYSEYSWTHGL